MDNGTVAPDAKQSFTLHEYGHMGNPWIFTPIANRRRRIKLDFHNLAKSPTISHFSSTPLFSFITELHSSPSSPYNPYSILVTTE